MSKEFKIKKIAKLKFTKVSERDLNDWFIKVASPTSVEKKLGLARTTTLRWKKKIKEEQISLQDLATVTQYKQLIELEELDRQAQIAMRKENKDKVTKKEIEAMKRKLTKIGFNVSEKEDTAEKNSKQDSENLSLSQFENLSIKDMKAYISKNKDKLGTAKTKKLFNIMRQKAKRKRDE